MARYLVWLLLLFVFVLSPFVGAVELRLDEIFDPSGLASSIFFDLRVPRVVFAFFAGAILALGGLLFQTLFRNSLMTPYTLGVSSGAVLGAGVAIKLGLGSLFFGLGAVHIFGFFGALFSVFLLLFLSRFLKNAHHESLLLLGIALSLFYTSALMIIFYLGSAMQNDMLIRFTMGSLSIIGWRDPLAVAFIAVLLIAVIYIYRFELQLMGISDESAKLKGLDTEKTTMVLLIVSSFSIGILVSISGPIGFVGLITPHIVAKMHPSTVNKRIIKTAMFGGLFLVFCDTITRALSTQSEIPIGIITALIGGPFFIYLIMRKKQ